MNNTIRHTVRTITAELNDTLSPIYPREERTEISRILLEEITGMSRTEILACPLQPLSESETSRIFDALDRLIKNEPLQHVLGKAWFYGLEFHVNKNTLIPRPETEELVHKALEIFNHNPTLPRTFLDAGTGSGCIAITLTHENKDLNGYAFDINADALETAKANAIKNNTSVSFFQDDMLNFQGTELTGKLGVLISNPPYVLPSEKSLMRENVKGFEPDKALYAPENDPLLFYRNLKEIALKHIVPDGVLLFEINETMGNSMIRLFESSHFYNCDVLTDMRGKPRIFMCNIKEQ